MQENTENGDESGVICPECGAEFSEEPRSVGSTADIQCPRCNAEFDHPDSGEDRDDPFPDPDAIGQAFESIRAGNAGENTRDSGNPDDSESFESEVSSSIDQSPAGSFDDDQPPEQPQELDIEPVDSPRGSQPTEQPQPDDSAQPSPPQKPPESQRTAPPPNRQEPDAERTPARDPRSTAQTNQQTEDDRKRKQVVKRMAFLAGFLTLFSLVLGTCGYVFVAPLMQGLIPNKATASSSPAGSTDAALRAAKNSLHGAIPENAENARFVKDAADRYLQSNKLSKAGDLLGIIYTRLEKPTKELSDVYIQTLMASEDFSTARDILVKDKNLELDRRKRLFNETLKKQVETENRDARLESQDFESAKPIWTENRVFVELEAKGDKDYILKPSLEDNEDYWRRELASSRLSDILGLGETIPRSRYAEFPKKRLEALLREDAPDVFDKLEWSTDSDTYLKGALTEKVQNTVAWPVHYYDLWRNWVGAPGDVELDQTLTEFAEANNADLSDELTGAIEGSRDPTLRRIVKDLSDILLFDFLTNNFYRFQTRDNHYGRNMQFGTGRLYGVSNDLAFEDRTSRRVEGRFEWLYRFNPKTVDRLRWVDSKPLVNWLFPSPSPDEEVRIDVFLEQKERALDRIRDLEESYGDDIYL